MYTSIPPRDRLGRQHCPLDSSTLTLTQIHSYLLSYREFKVTCILTLLADECGVALDTFDPTFVSCIQTDIHTRAFGRRAHVSVWLR